MSKKLGIIVPYRNRHKHLKKFLDYLPQYLSNRRFDYYIIVVNQDNASAFNRGMLCNIGFERAKLLNCDYVVFHDVDMLPIDVDYSYDNKPIHLATDNLPFDTYFGGITLFPVEDFQKVNGFSNLYWGWGFEDDDLRYRCIEKDIRLIRKSYSPINPNTSTQHFNGTSAYCTINNGLRFNKNFTINLRVTIDDIVLNHREDADKYTIFNIQGFDFDISYTSFKRFQLQFFDNKNNFYQIYSNIEKEKEFFISVTYNHKEKKVDFYLDGSIIGSQVMKSAIQNYGRLKDIFIGADNKLENLFRGSIQEISIYQEHLDSQTIDILSKNKCYSLTQNFEKYNYSENLISYFDTKFIKNYKLIDLSGNNTYNILVDTDCRPVDSKKVVQYIPYRKDSKINFLKHDNNGFVGGRWKDDLTRWNQLRFTNEVEKGYNSHIEDGLSTLQYTLHGEIVKNRYHHLNVGI